MSDYDILYPTRTCEFCGEKTNSQFRSCCVNGAYADTAAEYETKLASLRRIGEHNRTYILRLEEELARVREDRDHADRCFAQMCDIASRKQKRIEELEAKLAERDDCKRMWEEAVARADRLQDRLEAISPYRGEQ